MFENKLASGHKLTLDFKMFTFDSDYNNNYKAGLRATGI